MRWIWILGKPWKTGRIANQRLNLAKLGRPKEDAGQDFKPYLGNPAVRHYRGASENVAMVEL